MTDMRDQDGGGTSGAGNEWDNIARAFTDARMRNVVLSDYPGTMPTDLASGYAIQERALASCRRTIGGWKVGRIPPDRVAHYGTDRLAGPVMADTIVHAAGEAPVMPLLAGFAAAEGEIMVRMATIPDRWDAVDDLADHIAEIRLGIEIASSPYTGINDHGPAVTISDFGNNNGLVLGPLLDGWGTTDWRHMPMQTAIDGNVIGEAVLAQMLDGPFGAIAFLIKNLRARGRALATSDWVSTGAVTGVHPIDPGARIEVRFGDRTVSCRTR